MITYDESLKIKNNDLLGYDGIILSGGGEINQHKKSKLNTLRDNFEKKLLNVSIKNKLRLLVCIFIPRKILRYYLSKVILSWANLITQA